jgi:hypothetical protein
VDLSVENTGLKNQYSGKLRDSQSFGSGSGSGAGSGCFSGEFCMNCICSHIEFSGQSTGSSVGFTFS